MSRSGTAFVFCMLAVTATVFAWGMFGAPSMFDPIPIMPVVVAPSVLVTKSTELGLRRVRVPLAEAAEMVLASPIDRYARVTAWEESRDDVYYGLPLTDADEERWSFIAVLDELEATHSAPDYAQLWSVPAMQDAYLQRVEAAMELCLASGEDPMYLLTALVDEPERFEGHEDAVANYEHAGTLLLAYMNPDDVEQGD